MFTQRERWPTPIKDSGVPTGAPCNRVDRGWGLKRASTKVTGHRVNWTDEKAIVAPGTACDRMRLTSATDVPAVARPPIRRHQMPQLTLFVLLMTLSAVGPVQALQKCVD